MFSMLDINSIKWMCVHQISRSCRTFLWLTFGYEKLIMWLKILLDFFKATKLMLPFPFSYIPYFLHLPWTSKFLYSFDFIKLQMVYVYRKYREVDVKYTENMAKYNSRNLIQLLYRHANATIMQKKIYFSLKGFSWKSYEKSWKDTHTKI